MKDARRLDGDAFRPDADDCLDRLDDFFHWQGAVHCRYVVVADGNSIARADAARQYDSDGEKMSAARYLSRGDVNHRDAAHSHSIQSGADCLGAQRWKTLTRMIWLKWMNRSGVVLHSCCSSAWVLPLRYYLFRDLL